MGLFGPPNVEKLKEKRDLKGLIKALRYKRDGVVRQTAAEVLGEIGDARAVEPLLAALRDEDSDVREAAAEALGKIGDARAAVPLRSALGEHSHGIMEAARKASLMRPSSRAKGKILTERCKSRLLGL